MAISSVINLGNNVFDLAVASLTFACLGNGIMFAIIFALLFAYSEPLLMPSITTKVESVVGTGLDF